ncbi:MAG: hypothetical protein DCF25_13460 [Leptolyngbya foveolarum]|uniref:Uncharacterized protein n=1 Tax=Leptolyngbya foveolarum TaxID=47253 RepID=A0A2W4U321_9CYAN|nr:MAG: hypothetical protein DCF25_13460 [Leptolyngbya foveolarum]
MTSKKSAALPGKPRAKKTVPDIVADAFVNGSNVDVSDTSKPAVSGSRSVGRPKTGKRSNPEYARLTAWVPEAVLEALKIEALKQKCDLGDLLMERLDLQGIDISGD